MSKKLCRAEIVIEQMKSNQQIPIKFVYVSRDKNGKMVFKEKGTIGQEIICWMLDRGFFSSPIEVMNLALNYELSRLGHAEELEAMTQINANEMQLILKKKNGDNNGLQSTARKIG